MSEERFNLSRRKALAALGTIGVASAGAGLGTSAYFSDQETFENNQLTAGTLDLGVGYTTHYSNWSSDEDNGVSVRMYDGAAGETGSAGDLQPGETGMPTNDAWLIAVDDPDTFLSNTQTGTTEGNGSCGSLTQADGESAIVSVGDVKPGDFGEVTFDLELCTNPGYVWMNNPNGVTADENGVTEPEADDPQEDGAANSTDPADVELLDVVQAAVWLDDGDNYQDGGESPLLSGDLRNVLNALNSGNGVRIDGQNIDASGSKPDADTFTTPGVNRFDNDGDGNYDVDVELVGNPDGSGQVAHLTSGGQSTTDYATTAVSVGETIGNISSLTYDYYEGANNTAANPDEVWILIEESNGSRHVVWQNGGTGNDGTIDDSWQTRDVGDELSGSGSTPGLNGWMRVTDTGHVSLGGTPESEYGSDAEVVSMAAGVGGLSGAVSDVYVTNPSLNSSSLSAFPTACFRGETDFSAAFAWWVPVDHGNQIQSDIVEFDLGFYTEQCRHNDGSGMNNAAVTDEVDDDTES